MAKKNAPQTKGTALATPPKTAREAIRLFQKAHKGAAIREVVAGVKKEFGMDVTDHAVYQTRLYDKNKRKRKRSQVAGNPPDLRFNRQELMSLAKFIEGFGNDADKAHAGINLIQTLRG